MALQYPNRAGFIYTLQSCTLQEGPEVLKGIRGISFSVKTEGRKGVFGNGETIIGYTRGQKMFEGSVKMILDSALDYIGVQSSLLDVSHTFTVSLEEGTRLDSIKIDNAVFTEFSADISGNEEIEVEIPFLAELIYINGKPLASKGPLANVAAGENG
jgi:hypothetical protein